MGKSRKADDEFVKADLRPKPRKNRAMLHEETPAVTIRQRTLAEQMKAPKRRRKVPKVPPATKRTRDAALRIATRAAAKGY